MLCVYASCENRCTPAFAPTAVTVMGFDAADARGWKCPAGTPAALVSGAGAHAVADGDEGRREELRDGARLVFMSRLLERQRSLDRSLPKPLRLAHR